MALKDSKLRAHFTKRFLKLKTNNCYLNAMWIISLDIAMIITLTVLTIAATRLHWTVVPPIYLVAIIFIGIRQRSFSNIIHECSHGTFIADRKGNELFGRFLSILLFSSFDNYRHDHVTHHKFTGDYAKDRDFVETQTFGFHENLNFRQWRRHLKRILTFEFIPFYISNTIYQSSDSFTWRVIRSCYIVGIALIVLSIFGGYSIGWIVLGFWIVPLVITLPAVGYISDIMDHAGLLNNESELDKSRNYIVENTFIRWLFFPRNDTYHLVHHLFPAVPTCALSKCHAILVDEWPEYGERRHYFHEWWKDFQVLQQDSATNDKLVHRSKQTDQGILKQVEQNQLVRSPSNESF